MRLHRQTIWLVLSKMLWMSVWKRIPTSMKNHQRESNVEALETYAHAHTLPDGTFASPLEEENFNLLKGEFERQRTQNNPFLEDEGELGESSAPAISNVQVFEKVLGAQRGIYRGLGHKPSLSSASSDVSPHEKEKTRP
ncbi:hypothetical protein HanPSC8_Chr16g0713181 [Helianthus annuus]|nr:hypothetical protein HanPSC8_Chr16g0713181 [Helianthus annuus]